MSATQREPKTLVATFVRIVGSPDRIYVKRRDGSETSWTFPSYGEGLPHDLVHLVVESAFGVRRGFWGRVDDGISVTKVNEQANRLGGRDKYVGFGADLAELYVAEGLAVAPWQEPVGDGEVAESIAKLWSDNGLEPARVEADRVRDVRAALDRLRSRWRELAPKGALELTFSVEDLDASFRALID